MALTDDKRFMELIASLIETIEEEDEETVFSKIETLASKLKPSEPLSKPKKIAEKRPLPVMPFGFPTSSFFVQNNSLEKIGKALPIEEAQFIHNSIIKLSIQLGRPAHFLGKVLTQTDDYFVIWSFTDGVRTPELPMTPAENELNALKFFIALSSEDFVWRELPRISRSLVRQSRKIRTLLSGEPLRDMQSFGFRGTEQQFLRCQLTRMLCSSLIVPKSSLKVEELDNGSKILPDEETLAEWKMTLDDVSAPENMIHPLPHLRAEGSFTPLATKTEDEKLAELKLKAEEADPLVGFIRSAAEDTENLWRSQVIGNKTQIGKEDVSTFCVVVWEHTVWKGAINVFDLSTKTWSFLYTGFLEKRSETLIPEFKIEISKEIGKERKVQKEPNHWEEPKEPEPEKEDGEIKEGDAELGEEQKEEGDLADQQADEQHEQVNEE